MSLDNLSYWEANEKFPKVDNYFNVLEHADDFPELPQQFNNKNKNVNHWYKEKSHLQPKVWNNKPHFTLPTENHISTNEVITNNPHRTDEFEKLVNEVNEIQTKLNNYLGGKESRTNPGILILDGLLIDLKRSEEILTINIREQEPLRK